MTRELPTPPLPVLAKAKGESVSQVAEWFIEHFNKRPAPFNYRRGVRSVRASFKGLHSLPVLLDGCNAEPTAVGLSSNSDIVRLAAPLAFGRSTRVVDLSPRRFPFGRGRHSAYRIPFFFIENRVVHAYLLQPSKFDRMTDDEIAMIATIAKSYLLDTEFYGEQTDIEFVSLQAPEGAKERLVVRHNLSTLPLWTPRRLEDRLTLVAEGFDLAISSGRIAARERREHPVEADMPLFD